MQRRIVTLMALLLPLAGAQGQVFTYAFGGGDIPDDTAVGGLSLSGTVPADTTVIRDIKVTLAISGVAPGGAFNGDLYAWVKHDTAGGTGFAVLLNRVGTTTGDSFGYGDNGLTVTFDDKGASSGDIHVYRQILYGSDATSIPSPGSLGGIWQTDGRETDPLKVVASDGRTATLDSFVGLDPSGKWELFVQDLSGGGVGKVDYWNIEIAGATAVPEPGEMAVATGLALGGWLFWRRRQGR